MPENQSSNSKRRRKSSDYIGALLAILLSPLIIAVVILALICSVLLHIIIWAFYCSRGTTVLFVYSNSPVWKEYIETNILPNLPESAIKLNWSDRKQWKTLSLSTIAFRHFGGYREFNPLGVVFRPLRRSKVFRFWKPFKDFKHGNTDSLNVMRADFLNQIQQQE